MTKSKLTSCRRKVPWTALAEWSGDSALERTERDLGPEVFRPHESGVALRFPPQSKTRPDGQALLRTAED